MYRVLFAAIACLVLGAGCIETKAKLSIAADGSGALTVERVIAPAMAQALRNASGHQRHFTRVLGALPISDEEVRQLAGADGIEARDIRFEKGEDGSLRTHFTLAFADIHAFTRGPGRQLLPFRIQAGEDGRATFALTGFWDELDREAGDNLERMREQFAMTKVRLRGGSLRCEVLLPGAVESTVGGKADDQRVAWAWDGDTVSFDDLFDADGKLRRPQAVFRADQVAFELPVSTPDPGRPRRQPDPSPAVAARKVPLVARDPEEQARRYKVRATRLNGNFTINFHDDKVQRHGSSSLQLSIAYPEDIEPVRVSAFEVESLLTAAGEQLAAGCRATPQAVARSRHSPGPEPRMLHLNLQVPRELLDAQAIRELRGAFELIHAEGRATLKIDPVGEHIGQAIPVPDLDDVTVTLVEMKGPTDLWVSFSGNSHEQLMDVRMFGADGEEIRHHATGRQGDTHRYYAAELSADGAVQFTFAKDLERERVPVQLTDLELAGGRDQEALPVAAAGADFPARIDNISANRSIQIGAVTAVEERPHANVRLAIDCPEGIEPMHISQLEIGEAVGAGGVDLRVSQMGPGNSQVRAHRRRADGPRTFGFHCNLADQLLQLPRLERLTGSYVLTCAAGTSQAVAEPALEWLDRDLTIPDREHIDIRILELGEEETLIRYDHATYRLLQDVRLERADGTPLQGGTHTRGDDGYYYVTYRAAVPPDGRIVFLLHDRIQRLRVPIEITDVPLE